jgi:hypothetical protein
MQLDLAIWPLPCLRGVWYLSTTEPDECEVQVGGGGSLDDNYLMKDDSVLAQRQMT